MKTLILDTNALIKAPELISLASKEYHVIIPDVVLKSYRNMIDKNNYFENLKNSFVKFETDKSLNIGATSGSSILNISDYSNEYIDNTILKYLIDYKNRHETEEIIFVTNDLEFINKCKNNRIACMRVNEVLKILRPGDIDKNEIIGFNQIINKNKKKSAFIIIAIIFITIVLCTLIVIFFKQFLQLIFTIVSIINIWGTVILILIIGCLFYLFRSKNRLGYGLFETIVGIISSISVFLPNFDYTSLNANKLLQLLGGIYIIVRGMDNIGVGLQESPYISFANKWKIFFQKRIIKRIESK